MMDLSNLRTPSQPDSWQDWLKDKWGRLKLADMGLGMEKDIRRQHVTEHAIQKAYEITGNGQKVDWPAQLEEEVAVSVGDTLNVTNNTPAGSSLLTAASLLLGGLGMGAAAVSYLGRDAAPAASVPAIVQPAEDDRRLETGLSVERGGALR